MRYIHPRSLVPWEWLYRGAIYPPPLSSSRGEGVIPWHFIFIPHNIWWGGDYFGTYFHSPQYLVRGWLYRTLHFHSWHLVRGWLHRNIIFSVATIFGGGGYIVTVYFHSWQYLVRRWLYPDLIFSFLTIFGGGGGGGGGVIISWPYIFTPSNVWWGGDYIVTFSLLTIFGEGVIIFSLLMLP